MTSSNNKPEQFDAEAIIAQSIRDRGDMFAEFQLFMRALPKAALLNQKVAATFINTSIRIRPGRCCHCKCASSSRLCNLLQKAKTASRPTMCASCGMTPKQILEAVSCVIPMTGTATMPVAVRAMRQAGLI